MVEGRVANFTRESIAAPAWDRRFKIKNLKPDFDDFAVISTRFAASLWFNWDPLPVNDQIWEAFITVYLILGLHYVLTEGKLQ